MYRPQEDNLTALSSSPPYLYASGLSPLGYQDTYQTLADRSTSAPDLFLERKKLINSPSAVIAEVLESPATCSSDEKYCDKGLPPTDLCLTEESKSKDRDTALDCILTDKIFKIVNLDTGEAIDIRDENKDNFTFQFSKLTKQNYIDLKEYL